MPVATQWSALEPMDFTWPAVRVDRHGEEALVFHPEGVVEPLLELGRFAGEMLGLVLAVRATTALRPY